MGVDTKSRIASIDALRGFDMLMIIFADRFFYTLDKGANTKWSAFLANQFDHPEWLGSTFYDIIMPLFLFIVGAVIPFALSKRVQENSGMKTIYFKLLRRFVILFILGWIVQGNLLDWDINTFHVFSNTLQAIAVGYVVACLAYIHLEFRGQLILFFSCLILYAILMVTLPLPGIGRSSLVPNGNIAIYLDRLIMGRFDDGTQYTWILSGLGFAATTLSGMFAGMLIKSKLPRLKVAQYLALIGGAALFIGIIWGIWHPIVKKVWSSSFVMASSGVCFLLMALFYWIIDVKGWTKWAFPLKVIGMNAIVAYVVSHVIYFPKVADQILHGLEKYMGGYYQAVTVVGGFILLYWILWYMYKKGTFVKI